MTDDRITPVDLKPVPHIDHNTDFATVYGAARHWYNQYIKADRKNRVAVVYGLVTGVAAGWAVTQWLLSR
jgi:hypothetical protein